MTITSSQTQSQSTNTGVSGLMMLTIALVVLKVLGYLHWSWWWVFAPLWIPWSIVVGIILIIGLVQAALFIADERKLKKRKARKP